MTDRIIRARTVIDYAYAGDGTLNAAGQNAITKLEGVPTSLPVTVVEASTFVPAYFIFSNEDGTWEIPNVSTEFEFLAIARDTTKALNSAVRDWMVPE